MYSFIDSASEHAAALSHFHSYALFFLILVIIFVIWVLKLVLKFVLFERNLEGFNTTESFFSIKYHSIPSRASRLLYICFNHARGLVIADVTIASVIVDTATAIKVLRLTRKILNEFGTKHTTYPIYPDLGNKINVFSTLPRLIPLESERRRVDRTQGFIDFYLKHHRSEARTSAIATFRRQKYDLNYMHPWYRIDMHCHYLCRDFTRVAYPSAETYMRLHTYLGAYPTYLKFENYFFKEFTAKESSSWNYSAINLKAALGVTLPSKAGFHKLYSVYVTPVEKFAFFYGTDSRALFYLFFQHVRHRKILEWVWTCIPAAILMLLLYPSLILLYCYDRPYLTLPYLTFKAIGHQWYWSYEYSDFALRASESLNHVKFDSYMTHIDELSLGQFRLLEVDRRVILPIGICMRLITTSSDVLHSWAVPALGVKIDAVPGRLNQFWIVTDRPGTFYGQCSELCGVNHGFMPIAVECTTFTAFFQALNAAANA